MNKKFAELLKKFGIKPHLKGYHMSLKALEVMATKPLPANMGGVYEEVAEKEITTCKPSNVERGIRHAIEISWQSENAFIHNIFYTRPVVSEFLHEIVEMVRLEAVA